MSSAFQSFGNKYRNDNANGTASGKTAISSGPLKQRETVSEAYGEKFQKRVFGRKFLQVRRLVEFVDG